MPDIIFWVIPWSKMLKEWFLKPESSLNKVEGSRSMCSCPRCDVAQSLHHVLRVLRRTGCLRNGPKTVDYYVRTRVRHLPKFSSVAGVCGSIRGVPPRPSQSGAAAPGFVSSVVWGAGGWGSERIQPVCWFASSGAITRPERLCGYTALAQRARLVPKGAMGEAETGGHSPR